MRRRLAIVKQAEPAPLQQYFHAEAANAVKAVIANLNEITTFTAIADAIGYTHEYVRLRLVNDPNVMKVGKNYRVPKATAARFITGLLLGKEKAA
jgi:hypothetical protein